MVKDVHENELQRVEAAALVRCLDQQGNSKVITSANLLNSCLQARGVISDGGDLNKYYSGIYCAYPEYGTVLNGPSFVRFMLVCFATGGHLVQIAVNVHPQSYQIQYRTSYSGGVNWEAWKSISIT